MELSRYLQYKPRVSSQLQLPKRYTLGIQCAGVMVVCTKVAICFEFLANPASTRTFLRKFFMPAELR